MNFNGRKLIEHKVREERVFTATFPIGTNLIEITSQLEKEEEFKVYGYHSYVLNDRLALVFRTTTQDLSEELVSYIILKYGGLGINSRINHVFMD